ncbi:class I SAM-dependent methyltransferase [Phaeobacter inhibens]|nr:methyltransferase domain-containing protein [Phaeobacter inhibens]AUQ63618.1 Methylase involved in ubiquinone/menaquinone biosynthesis [Phaeobacter inhibens]AUQ83523.1 Methylase involved in ubiquinone/menaquinone biosynthesis [Phaeobacter inhibens]AUQ91283.1 Methylase involved in ubiquinone/menaquinone biosynthesis [Phaeobacter inhibens]MDO6756736.1 methyltransferase domain-containing protein [Phaeobacter inhibens]
MADPFQDVDSAGPEFVKMFADAMDVRQSDPTMEQIVASYLDRLPFAADSLTIEVGAGAGAVTRRIATLAHPTKVVGYEPSKGFVNEAIERSSGHSNLSFVVADGASLPIEDKTVDAVVMHTVLTHVTHPESLLAEAFRVLKAGGSLVICDADFSKSTFSSIPNDPLNICAQEFVREFVTDAFIVGKLRTLIANAGMEIASFDVTSRVVTSREQMRPWVEVTTKQMVERGDIGKDLADALVAEHDRRAELGSLYGYQAFATAIARKPY